ncbi:hypothetical protein MMALV_06960 [Candidatus Methanomethylophilus alvi Mx1201]|uniref:Uncharacterized protein n=2 Tax=Methanomethylophilus alvi TaxID=1291540 RepID=M9SDG4_METAX|nr:hypothetical protein MMALV_06960 [Candidatus Methanomethylophilus alvi Mx1201]
MTGKDHRTIKCQQIHNPEGWNMAKYDYSRFKDPDWSDDWVYQKPKPYTYNPDKEPNETTEEEKEYVGWPDPQIACDKEYWGIHEVKGGRLEIDVRRFEYACYRCGDHDPYFPEALRKKGPHYIASKVHRHDYTFNYLMDSIRNLKEDWNYEYKPLFNKVFSPKDAEDNYRTNTMMMFGDSEMFDSVELGSKWAYFNRMNTYYRIQAELYYTFLTKVIIEIHRIILRAMTMQLYQNTEYSVFDLKTYCNGAGVDFYHLKNWKVYLKYNDIYNFLKHNSIQAYEKLKKFNSKCLIETDQKYENGMFAMDWLNSKEINIDELLSDIVPFLQDFCKKVLGEDLKQAEWDYDDYFIETQKELEDPMEHFGIYGACGMSPWD